MSKIIKGAIQRARRSSEFHSMHRRVNPKLYLEIETKIKQRKAKIKVKILDDKILCIRNSQMPELEEKLEHAVFNVIKEFITREQEV